LEAIQPRLETRPAADRYNELAEDFNRRCGGRSASNERQEEVAAAIAASRESIEAAAIEEVRTLNDAVPFSTTEAQELLSMLGYDPGVVDGVFSEQTRAAIKAFQKRNGGPMDGLLSRELFDQLGRALARYRIQSERCRVRSSESQQQRADFRC
jgi:murein L,D-transpeptidase YcbB/YkuD